ncbi:MAG: hypothetical protein R3F07_06185 [Opitutaceae bacterium]
MKKANNTAATAKPATGTAAAKPTVKKTVKKTAARKTTAAKKAPAATSLAPSTTPVLVSTIRAHIDIGFGNLLFLRGDGPGLSWEKGMPMACVKDTLWSWTTKEAVKPFTFKVLVNDLSWSVGEDYTAHAGQITEIEPSF